MKEYIVFGIMILFIGASFVSCISGIIQKNEGSSDFVWLEQDKLIAYDGASDDWFGRAVAISGDYAVVGAEEDQDYGPSTGAAYIFQRNGSNWVEMIKLLALDPNDGDSFGNSVAISGEFAIIGSIFDDDNGWDSGSAYIFKRENNTWFQQSKLIASDGEDNDRFGKSVSIDGDYAIVGARYDYNYGQRTGSAYIFKRNGSNWIEQAKLLASDAGGDANFGYSVSISGDYAIIGAPQHADNGDFAGAAYIFKRNGTTWTEQAKLLASDGEEYDFLGISCSISSDNAIVGAYGYTIGSWDEAGAAYIFTHDGLNWYETDILTASDIDRSDRFGFSVSIDNNYSVVGSPYDFENGQYSGSAYIFNFNGVQWLEQDKISPNDGDEFDNFGNSVSIDGDYSLAGAFKDDDNGSESGSAYVFNKTEIPNQPPYTPSNPDPFDGETNVDVNHDLSWSGGDPDPDDTVTYDVYFGTTSPPPQVATGQSGTTYEPGTMIYDEIYYWQIVSWDNHGASTSGPEWDFTTEEEPPKIPDLDCSGTLVWTGVSPGDTVSENITVENVGDPDSLLDWEIESYPDWGTWSFDPDGGIDLLEGDSTIIDVEVIAPNVQEETFIGEVVLVNSEDSCDTCTIDVSLATPVNKPISIFVFPFIQKILDLFPNIFPVLRVLLTK